ETLVIKETDKAWWPQNVVPLSTEHLNRIQSEFIEKWQQIASAAHTGSLAPLADRRFAGQAWQESPQHLMMAHLYLLSSQIMGQMVDQADLPTAVRERLRFSVEQWNDAVSPSNYFLTNPDVIKAFAESNGTSLQQGFLNLLGDLRKGHISQTDESSFEVGGNLALTPGAVVFENAWFQLLQYAPQTATVHQRPLLMVPPCINKY